MNGFTPWPTDLDQPARQKCAQRNRRDRMQDAWCRAWPFLLILGIAILFGLLQNRQDPQRDASAAYEAAETLLVGVGE